MKRKFVLKNLSMLLVFVFAGYVWAGETDNTTKAQTQPGDPTSIRCGKGAGSSNPATLHCLKLGYEVKSVEDEDGGQYSICLFPDGNFCDTWRFLEGRCGAPYSYCAKKGYGVISKSDGKAPFSSHYAVCVDGQTEVGSVTMLMELAREYETVVYPGETSLPFKASPAEERLVASDQPLPASFDWRNHDGQNWMTPVKDQSDCGSCWAFSAVATVEALYNIYTNMPDLDLDLSEEYLVGGGRTGIATAGCCYGIVGDALTFIRDQGIPDEDCLPYDVDYYNTGDCHCYPYPPCNPDCAGLPFSCSHTVRGDACEDVAQRLIDIDDYFSVPEDQGTIKERLIEKGPLSGKLCSKRWTIDGMAVVRCTYCWDLGDIFELPNGVCDSNEDKNGDGVCDQDDCIADHWVNIVGYDDAGGYWIVRNSWGTSFHDGGYFKVGYGECHVEKNVYYAEPATDINFAPIAVADGPYSAECGGVTTDVLLDGSESKDPNGDQLTYSWTTDCPGGSFDDATIDTPKLTVNTSAGCSVACNVSLTVIDSFGSDDTSETSVSMSDTQAPVLTCPASSTIECDQLTDPSNTGTATANDTCDASPAVTYTDVTAPNSGITRTWTATDACANQGTCTQTITVEDATAPVIQSNAPDTITPPDAPISFTATVTDNCDSAPSVEITGYDCYLYTKKGKRIDKTPYCVVEYVGDTITILDSGGVGDNIEWTVSATDNSGNELQRTHTLVVVTQGKP